jgi:hypothetical protein
MEIKTTIDLSPEDLNRVKVSLMVFGVASNEHLLQNFFRNCLKALARQANDELIIQWPITFEMQTNRDPGVTAALHRLQREKLALAESTK